MSAPERLSKGAWSWALFEWARNPYVILIGIYVFAPYVATTVIGDPVRGQEIMSGWHKISGLLVACTAPFLGAVADSMGRRKPLLAAILALFIPGIALLWFAQPGDAGLPLWAVGLLVIANGVTYTWTEVLHNAMITQVAPPSLVPRASGLGFSLGNAASVLLLVFVLLTIALPGTVLPGQPLFGLDPAKYEPARSVTVLCALWLLVFSLPLFFYAPDGARGGTRLGVAVTDGFARVARTIRKLRDYRNVALFLVARMIYADGKTAILIFSGVYASGVMGWGLIEMLIYGVMLSVLAVSGGFAADWLETRFGTRNAVLVEIGVTLTCLLVMVSLTLDSIFFVIPVDPAARVWDGPIFQTVPEIIYLCASMIIAVSITAAYASSRTLMAKLSPRGMEGELFGLYALSGAATVWLGPLLVEQFTRAYESQRAGFGAISILLVVGFALLLLVKSPDAERD